MNSTKKVIDQANVFLWGDPVGTVIWDKSRDLGIFQYNKSFVSKGLQVSPLLMPLNADMKYAFPALDRTTYYGLPPLLADALPDKFGNALIDIWLRDQGRELNSFSPVERLCYMGKRAMGALEFRPATARVLDQSIEISIDEMSALAQKILTKKAQLSVNRNKDSAMAIRSIIEIGTSAGGNRAKAVIVWNKKTGEIRSGQVDAPAGFEHWIIKFDNVSEKILGDPHGYGRVEYAYYNMAIAAGINMNPCRLWEENGRAHFMTQRFDRGESGQRLHMQSLCALAGYDFNQIGKYHYEEVFGIIQKLRLGHQVVQEQYRRMVFNVMARCQDDHAKNISFLMTPDGKWDLSPAYDNAWSYSPKGLWTSQHQMRVNGKRDGFTIQDLIETGKSYEISKAKTICEQVGDAIARWSTFSKKSGVSKAMIQQIAETHRKELFGKRNQSSR